MLSCEGDGFGDLGYIAGDGADAPAGVGGGELDGQETEAGFGEGFGEKFRVGKVDEAVAEAADEDENVWS